MRVGLPRALQYYEFYPLWRTFLERSGFEVVMSAKTTKAVLERGVALAADEACLPVKLALGHVDDLVGRCDAIFVPRLITMEPNGFLCPKIVGLPDIVRALPLDCPEIIDPTVDFENEVLPADTFVLAAKRAGAKAGAAREAFDAASRAQEEFMSSVHAGRPLRLAIEDFERGKSPAPGEAPTPNGEEASSGGPGGRLRIALLGHPYNVHDPYLSMEIAERLEALGCDVIPVETVDPSLYERAIEGIGRNVYWVFGRRVLGPVLHFMEHGGVDGLIYVVSFGCGPDALLKALVDLWAKRRPELPYMSLVLDEHSGEAGLLTRLEAFVDMTRRVRRAKTKGGSGAKAPRTRAEGESLTRPASREAPAAGPRPKKGSGRRSGLVSFPHIGIAWIPLRAVMEDLGLNVLVPPETTRRTLDIGAAHSPELACIPFKLLLGNYVEALDRGATHILGLSSRFGASCRLYFFPAAHEAILRDMGYEFELVALDSGRRDSGNEIAGLTRERIGKSKWEFAKLFFATFMRKLLACERAELLAMETRPFEAKRGESTRVMRRALKRIDACEPRKLRRLMTYVDEEFRRIERVPDRRPLRVGVVGEQFVVIDAFSNHNIEERLGDLGALVKRNFWISSKIARTIWRWLSPEYARAMRAASKYLGVDIGAECNVTVGDAVEYRRHGFDGLVHLMPFSCMPEIVAESILPRVKARNGMPVITFALDEQTSDAGMQTRLEAFMDLLSRQRDRRRLGAGGRKLAAVGAR